MASGPCSDKLPNHKIEEGKSQAKLASELFETTATYYTVH